MATSSARTGIAFIAARNARGAAGFDTSRPGGYSAPLDPALRQTKVKEVSRALDLPFGAFD
jgi:hypothetical protein